MSFSETLQLRTKTQLSLRADGTQATALFTCPISALSPWLRNCLTAPHTLSFLFLGLLRIWNNNSLTSRFENWPSGSGMEKKAGDSMQKYHYSDYYLWFFFFFTLWLIFCCSASLVTPLGWHAPLWVPVDSTPTETEAENKPSCRYLQSLERKEFILDGINLWKVKNSIV